MQQKQEKINIKEREIQSKRVGREKHLLAIMLLIAAFTTLIFAVQVIVDFSMNYDSSRTPGISYFTIQSNIIISVWLVLVGLNMLTGRYKIGASVNLASIVTTYILVTGVIYWGLLVPMFFGLWMFSPSNIWMHTTTPVIAVLMHRYIKSKSGDKKPELKLAYFYIYPVLYIIMALVYASNGTYLYPMFDVEALGWIGVAACLVVMLVVFTGVYVFLLRGRKKAKLDDEDKAAEIVHLR